MLILFLSACIPVRDEILLSHDDWRGTTTVTVNEREVFRSDDGDGLMTARPVITRGPDGRAFGVLLNVRRRDANEPRIDRVTSGRQVLTYTAHDRLLTHCIDGCQPAEVGVITLTEAAFHIAAQSGLPLRVWGQRGRYEGTVPAEAFLRVLAAVNAAPKHAVAQPRSGADTGAGRLGDRDMPKP
ncbi:hypothetical protein [Loktanella salsilacus]|uniref:hypothetical protein n=1 Tax=Loktanella salsilacus TaxID=195913 RepID=UPI00373562E1